MKLLYCQWLLILELKHSVLSLSDFLCKQFIQKSLFRRFNKYLSVDPSSQRTCTLFALRSTVFIDKSVPTDRSPPTAQEKIFKFYCKTNLSLTYYHTTGKFLIN